MAIDDAGVKRAVAVAAGNIGAASKVWGGAPGTPYTPTNTNPAAGTVISQSSRPNGDGTYTVTTVYADGQGGTYTQTSISGTPTTTNTSAQSAYDLLYDQFKQYGLESLVEPLKGMIKDGATGAQLSLALQNTDAYKRRFAANQQRINAGLRALSPAEYISLEDQYQNLMRNYGLPATYYTKGDLGIQEGFNKLIAGDVSATELESRLLEAQQKVNNANPEVKQALKQFYGDTITNGDILAYSLDPKNALNDIKRKVAAAEIGGAALSQSLGTTVGSAEALAAQGVTKSQAQQGYGTIAGYLPSAQKLADIYGVQGVGPYDQAAAEADVFGTAGSALAQAKRKKLTQLEQAAFSGQSGTSQGALSRDRALTNYMLGTPGAGAF